MIEVRGQIGEFYNSGVMRVESNVSKLGDSPAAKRMWEMMKKHWRQVGRDETDVGGGKRRRLADGVDSRNAKGGKS